MNFFQYVASRNDRKRRASTNWIFIASNEHFTRSAHLLTVIHLTYANHPATHWNILLFHATILEIKNNTLILNVPWKMYKLSEKSAVD